MLRGLRAPEFARSIAKNFDQVAFRYDAVVLFRRRLRWLFIPGGRDVLGSATVAPAGTDRLTAPIKFDRHRIFVAPASRARLYYERDGEGY